MTTPTRPAAPYTTPECQMQEHDLCKHGPVYTSYGSLITTVRCDCTCHGRKERGR